MVRLGAGHACRTRRFLWTSGLALAWSDLARVRPSSCASGISRIPGEPLHEVAKRIPGIKTPAVWLPHTIMGISTSDIREDLTGRKFGPFDGQFFVDDQAQSNVMRVTRRR